MWKILTAQIRKGVSLSLLHHGLFPEEQKICCWDRGGTGDLLNIDQQLLKEGKVKWKNVAIA